MTQDPPPTGSGSPEGDDESRIDRRAFLRRAGLVTALSAGAGWTALAPPHWPLSLKDPTGELGKPQKRLLRLPDGGFAVDGSAVQPALGVARGGLEDTEAMVRGAIDQIGGIERFVQRGDIVLIKPNVAFERAAILGATTNPDVLKALIHVVREANPAEIRVCDNPIEAPESCFQRTGIRQAAVDAGARVYLPHPAAFETLEVPGAKWIGEWPFFWEPFRNVNKVIGVSPVKDHNLCAASMTTKNWYGLLGGRRNQFHQDIHGIITDLALMMKPTFVVLDATRVMFRSGPTGGSLGDVREGNTVVASTDSLAADSYGWDELLDRKGREKPAYLAMAAEKGLGNPEWSQQGLKEVRVG